jgi:hypothetical protein
MSIEEATKHLEQIRGVVREVEPALRLEVGVQAADNSNLNYKLFRGSERLTDFEIFSLIPRNPVEAHRCIVEAFEKYQSHAKVIG